MTGGLSLWLSGCLVGFVAGFIVGTRLTYRAIHADCNDPRCPEHGESH